jgi:hypothetical protein
VGEFEGDVGVRVRRHATWNMERHLVTRRDPGMETHAACSPRCLFSPLLVVGSVLVVSPYCRGLNPSGLLLSVSYRRSQFSPRSGTVTDAFHGRVVPRALKAAAVYTLFVLFSGP